MDARVKPGHDELGVAGGVPRYVGLPHFPLNIGLRFSEKAAMPSA
jgi:hypothetical protein